MVDAAKETEQGNHYARPICLIATIDVKNAFNSVRWTNIIDALQHDFHVPKYILAILEHYLQDRYLLYETEGAQIRKELTAGVAQGSVLGPELWNISYNGILHLEMPDGAFLNGYADDIIAIVIARTMKLAEGKLNRVFSRVQWWMEKRGLKVATPKTEVGILCKKHLDKEAPITVGSIQIAMKPVVKYLGIHLDTKLNYGEHLKLKAEKAAAVTTNLSRLMANVRGPRSSTRWLLMRTAESIILYGAEIWAEAMRFKCYRQRIARVQRREALRIASAYRTVSEAAVLVVANTTPIYLQAEERSFVYQYKRALGETEALSQARKNTMTAWQNEWTNNTKARWTQRLIPRLAPWLDRQHGEVNYYLTQFLTGHGLFGAYLHKMGKRPEPKCHCGAANDDPLHMFFECDKWKEERRVLQQHIGRPSPDSIVSHMLESEEKWNSVATFVEKTLRKKKREEDEIS